MKTFIMCPQRIPSDQLPALPQQLEDWTSHSGDNNKRKEDHKTKSEFRRRKRKKRT